MTRTLDHEAAEAEIENLLDYWAEEILTETSPRQVAIYRNFALGLYKAISIYDAPKHLLLKAFDLAVK